MTNSNPQNDKSSNDQNKSGSQSPAGGGRDTGGKSPGQDRAREGGAQSDPGRHKSGTHSGESKS